MNIYIDESGSINRYSTNDLYFVISMIHVLDPIALERAYKRYLTALCKESNWQLTAFHKNHYEFSCFIRFRDRVVFLSIPDVRYRKNEWHSHILVRFAESEKDFRGGQNHYTDIPHLKQDIERLFASVSF